MANNRPQNVSSKLLSMSRTEWENIINEYIKNETDRYIAIRYYLDGITQQDLAEEVNYSRSGIKHKLPKLLNTIEKDDHKKIIKKPQGFFFYCILLL